MRGEAALTRFLAETEPCTVLDIGSGKGEHAAILRDHGYDVTTLDTAMSASADIACPYESAPLEMFEAIWCSHTLEHSTDPGTFLRKIEDELAVDGFLSITVPPRKDAIVGGHVTMWNAGLLLYQLILAGFDCSSAAVRTLGYDVTVQLRYRSIRWGRITLAHDRGDIERLAGYFPIPVAHGFDGVIEEVNW